MCFFNDIIATYWDILFDSDSRLVYEIIKSNYYPLVNVFKHPCIVIILKPFWLLFTALFHSTRVGGLFLQALLGSSTVCLVYSIVNKLTNRKNLALCLALIYGLSMSTITFSVIYELYIYTAFFNTLLLYYVLLLWKNDNPIKNIDYFILSLLTVFNLGTTIITFITSFILIIFLFIRKKQTIKNFLLFIFYVVILYFLNLFILKLGHPNYNVTKTFEVFPFYNFDYNLNRFLLALKTTFIQSLYGLKLEENIVHKSSKGIFFSENQSSVLYIPSLFLFTATTTVLSKYIITIITKTKLTINSTIVNPFLLTLFIT
ncbi:glycosyltransferase family 39 protein, partial [bacterium]|nr:glycosyltransferase family 39 protein [bacterium]